MANFLQIACDLDLIDGGWSNSEGANPSNPISNLSTYAEEEFWQSLTTVQNQYLYLDTNGDPRARTGLAVVNHNWHSLGATLVRVQATDVAGFGSGVVTAIDNMTFNNSGTDFVLFDGAASITKRYWRILFAKGSALSAAPKAGNVYLDDALDFGFPYDFPYRIGNRQYQTVEREMLNGLLRKYQSRIGRRTFQVSFKAQQGGFSDAVRTKWQALWERSRGPLRPVFIRDVDGTTAYYVFNESEEDAVEVFRYGVNGISELKYREALAQ